MELIKITRQAQKSLTVIFKGEQGVRSRRYKDSDSARAAQLRRVMSAAQLRVHQADPEAVQRLAEHQLAVAVLERLNAMSGRHPH